MHSYCAQQIRFIEGIKYQGKSILDVYSIGGIAYPALIHPTLAYYYLPLLQSKHELERSVYRIFLWVKALIAEFNTLQLFDKHLPQLSEPHLNNREVFFLNFAKKHFSQVFQPINELAEYRDTFSTVLISDFDMPSEKTTINMMHYYSANKTGDLLRHFPSPSLLDPYKKIALEGLRSSEESYRVRSDYFILMRDSIIHQSKKLAAYIHAGREILIERMPALVVGGDFCDPRCIIMFLLAKNLKIPTLVVQQGIMNEICSDFCFPVTDKVAIWNQATYEIITRMKAPITPYEITGNPTYDKYYNINSIERMSNKEKIILFLSQPSHRHGINKIKMIRMKKTILGSLQDLQNYRLVIKPHPDEKRKWFVDELNKRSLDHISVLNPNDNTTDWILKSDVIIGFYSTALIEGILAGRPVIVFDDEEKYNAFSLYEKEGGAYGVASAEAMKDFLKNIDQNEYFRESLEIRRRTFIERHVGNFDGKSAERILHTMLQMTKDVS